MALYQLEHEEEVKNKFQTVVIDTIGLAWNSCMQYICMQHGVKEISAIPWGQGWSKASQEFEESLRKITQLGYGLVIIAHSDIKTEKAPDGTDVTILGPAIPTRAYNIVNQLVDLIGYIAIEYDADGNSTRWLYTRKTPTIMAGSRFKYLPAKIKFGYQELVDAIAYALEKSEEDGDKVVDHLETNKNETLDYDALRKESEQLWNELVLSNPDQPNTTNAEKIHSIVSSVTGMDIKISDITRAQVDLLNLIVVQMRALKG